jgi:hypothetical protein
VPAIPPLRASKFWIAEYAESQKGLDQAFRKAHAENASAADVQRLIDATDRWLTACRVAHATLRDWCRRHPAAVGGGLQPPLTGGNEPRRL